MEGIIKKLYDDTGKIIFPVTHEKSIYMDDGKTLKANFDNINSQLADNIQQISSLALSRKPAFIEQFITGFYGRGQLKSEKIAGSAVTETNVIISRPIGYGAIEVADTTPFKEGTIIMIKHDDGTYASHFITAISSSTIINILPPLTKQTTTNTKVERGWYNSAHAGKFYMRYLAQRLANATELENGYGENIFYANFDGNTKDDIGVTVGTSTIGYNTPINKGTNYGTVLESGVGRTLFFSTSTVGGGVKFPSFFAKRGERLVLKIFAMNRVAANTTKIAVKSSTDEISSITITGAESQIMKPYFLEFYAPYDSDLLYVEITNQTANQNVVYVDEIRVMINIEQNNYILPRNGKILALGDSWVAGDLVNTTEREPITTHLSALLPEATIINKGVGGNKVQDILARFNSDVVPFRPDVVIIHTGTNDSYNPASGTFEPNSIDYYTGKLKELIQKCIDIGAKPVVVGTPALAEEDGTATNFLLNDRARLYNNRIYREFFKDNNSNPTIKLLSTNRFGKLEDNTFYASGNNFKDVSITIKNEDVKIKRIGILAQSFNTTISANVTLKIYNSDRTILLATSDTLTIEKDSSLQPYVFTLPVTTLTANTNYILAFEGNALWTVNEGGSGTIKDYGKFSVDNVIVGNTAPPTTILNKWIGILLIPPVGTQKIFVNNLPTRYAIVPNLSNIDSNGNINVLDDKNKLLISFYASLGDEFEYQA